uniref:Uncharacterized protein n=2 Tax=Brassica oleracea TaxID=3712 RepID=A0A0D2ZXM4_BRAOL
EEEEERSDRWNSFLEDHGSSEEKYLPPGPDLTRGDEKKVLRSQTADGLGKDIEMQDEKGSSADPLAAVEKWKGQIEKDLPRTFPGHPALDDDGRNALRRLLTLCWILSGYEFLCWTFITSDARRECFL